MENQLTELSTLEQDYETGPLKMGTHGSNPAVNLSKSANNLPPFASQGRVSKIKSAISGRDDDLERAQDSKIATFSQPQHAAQKSSLTRGSSQHMIDAECEKLKESYTQHRRQRNSQSRDRSRSGLGTNSRSTGRQVQLEGGLSLASIEKENGAENLRLSANSSTFQNRYKRTQSNQKSLQNYQEKYTKLEENFKRFTQGL